MIEIAYLFSIQSKIFSPTDSPAWWRSLLLLPLLLLLLLLSSRLPGEPGESGEPGRSRLPEARCAHGFSAAMWTLSSLGGEETSQKRPLKRAFSSRWCRDASHINGTAPAPGPERCNSRRKSTVSACQTQWYSASAVRRRNKSPSRTAGTGQSAAVDIQGRVWYHDRRTPYK